ncbi:hypothetical protein PSHT_01279 [Puccinia striiformis]|uniref:Uncharacterized protein n=1 Tax=Puccinia striiformis TaxID=27350 RepID=A0A2S4WKY3_9BASI|nr:hypothetical protein PSHT_01279 [Puccinia striiformis]
MASGRSQSQAASRGQVNRSGSDPMLFTQLNRLLTRAFLDEQNQDKVFKLAEYDEEISNDVHWNYHHGFSFLLS